MTLGSPLAGQWTMQIMLPAVQTSVDTLPVTVSFNNQVGPVLFGGGGSHPLGEAVSFSTAVMDGSNKVANLQISASLVRLNDATPTPVVVAFADDGQGADYSAGDSIYSAYVVPSQPGSYMLQVDVSGDASTGHFQRNFASGFKVSDKSASITGNVTIRPRVATPK